MSLHSFSLRRRRQRGITLILVLSFILLLTVVVLALLSRSITARQLSSGSLKQSSVDQFALSALDVVTGNLRQEVAAAANSSATTYNGTAPAVYTVYRPLTVSNILPMRFGNPAFTSPSPDPAPNLVRISSRSDGSQAFPSSLASAVNSTTDVAVNGRSVTLARWNSHYLLPVQNSGTANSNSTPVASFAPPDWVLVSDTGGPTVVTAPSAAIIGRYAYAIYDEAGLLDVNVAGYPSKSTITQYGDKSGLAYADLTQLALPSAPTTSLLSTSDVDNLVGWRNYASVQPTGSFGSFAMTSSGQTQNFFNLITGNVTGFLNVNSATWNNLTDQAFLSRQQLLQYRASSGFNANVLQYLGTFSRDINAPSWSPATPSGSTIDYAGQKNAGASANRDVLGVRVATSFVRADGTTAQVGEALVKYRFPLNRLAGLTYQGIDTTDKTTLLNGALSPATAATIQRDFGLIWGGIPSHWNYCGPSGSTVQSSIATLGAVANSIPGREPNFFELLKAAILSGSLGRDAGVNGVYLKNPPGYEEGPASGNQTNDLNSDLQIIQLGANIIDQSDTDSYPTEIHFIGFVPSPTGGANAETAVYGIENLPYLQRVFSKTLSNYTDTTTSPATTGAAGWYMAELWNPHQNSGYTNTSALPTQFRFCGDGSSAMFIPSYPNQDTDDPSWPVPPTPPNSSSYDLTKSGYLQFIVNPISGSYPNSCREPTLLSNDSSNPAQSNPPYLVPSIGPTPTGGTNGNASAYGGLVEGIYTGIITIPSDAPDQASAGIQPQGCDMLLEYQASDGTWRIYDKMRNLTGEHDWNPNQVAFYFQHVDPRADRFGTSLGQWTYSSASHRPGGSVRVDNSNGWNSYDYFPWVSSGFHYAAGTVPADIFNNLFYLGTLSDNVTGSNVYYADQDGIVRPAEGCYATGDANYDARPLVPCYAGNSYITQVENRPIILNRPFRNVGELGYTFRDLPWKDIDFFTPYTGDAGLLDFFCVNESTTTTPMVAGTVSLNTRQAPVLQAILAGSIKDETGTASPADPPIPNTEAASIASSIVAWTRGSSSNQGPFQYRGDLLTKASSTLVASSASSTDQQVKTRREAALRALSNACSTRTWTLLVDLVAQVGHYPPGATTLKQFVVDGEKRYWLHITLDRYTGQVVDRALEPVYE